MVAEDPREMALHHGVAAEPAAYAQAVVAMHLALLSPQRGAALWERLGRCTLNLQLAQKRQRK